MLLLQLSVMHYRIRRRAATPHRLHWRHLISNLNIKGPLVPSPKEEIIQLKIKITPKVY
jgi:hypothetical protein